MGLALGAVTNETSDTVPEGHVIRQSPEGGSLVRSGTVVTLVVSSGVGDDTVAPAVTLTAPAAGPVAGNAVIVTATATDNVGVAGVQFLLDGANLGAEDTSAPYSATFDATAATNGTHTLSAAARDAAGNVTTSAVVSVTVNNADTTAPAISLTAPEAGTISGAAVTVSATATDNVGVVGVQFRVDDANLGVEDTTAPYSITLNTTTLANGPHTLTARARDAAGNVTTSPAVSVTVSNVDATAPTIDMTSPPAGNVSGNAVALAAAANDNVGVAGVQFLLNGTTNIGAEDTTAPYTATFDSTTVADGPHTLSARARDAAGNVTTSAAVSVTVNNADTTAPTVTMTAPPAGNVSGNAVALAATASDNIGIVGVQFLLNGTTSIGAEDTTAPYTAAFDSTTVANGPHTLSARARDAAGNVTTSAGVSVTVSNTVADTTPPTATAPLPNVALNTVLETVNVPVAVSWSGADAGSGVVRYDLERSINGGTAWTAVTLPSATATTITQSLAPNANQYQYRVRAVDAAGNVGTFATGTTFQMTPVQDSSASIVYTGTWTAQAPANAYGGSTRSATAAGARASLTFTGTDVLVIAPRGSGRGIAEIWVDGVFAQTVDLFSTTAEFRRVVFARTGLAAGTHTVEFRATGTRRTGATSTRVDIDAFIVTGGGAVTPADTMAPTVTMTAPPAGNVSGTAVALAATASDNIGVVGVQFLLDGTTGIGAEDTTAPYTAAFDSTTVANGPHTLSARARDAAGNLTTSTGVSVTVSNTVADTTPPAATAPARNVAINTVLETVNVPVTLTWSGSDAGSGVARYDLERSIDGGTAWTAVALPSATATTITQSLAPNANQYRYRVRAVDAAGNVGTFATGTTFQMTPVQDSSASVVYTGTWTAQAPANAYGGSTRSATAAGARASLTFTGTDVLVIAPRGSGRGIAEIWVNGVFAQSVDLFSTTAEFRRVVFARTGLAAGTHTVEFRATGTMRAGATSPRVDIDAFIVTGGGAVTPADTTGPTVTMTAPPAGNVSGTAVALAATASDNIGVVGVQFLLNGTTSIGAEDTTAPYTAAFDSTTVANGPHTLSARARDAAGNVTTSAGVSVTVSNTVADTTPPAATAPARNVAINTVLETVNVPVTLTWSGSDAGSGVVRYDLERSIDGGTAWTAVTLPSATATTITQSLAPNANQYRYRVRAVDAAGNVGAFATGTTFRLTPVQDTSASVVYTGTWTAQAPANAYGGSTRSATAAGARASLTFTGTEVMVIAPRGSGRGIAEIWIDGVFAQTVDLFSTTAEFRRVIFRRTGLTAGTHTVEFRATGTRRTGATSTRVDIDAFITVQ